MPELWLMSKNTYPQKNAYFFPTQKIGIRLANFSKASANRQAEIFFDRKFTFFLSSSGNRTFSEIQTVQFCWKNQDIERNQRTHCSLEPSVLYLKFPTWKRQKRSGVPYYHPFVLLASCISSKKSPYQKLAPPPLRVSLTELSFNLFLDSYKKSAPTSRESIRCINELFIIIKDSVR